MTETKYCGKCKKDLPKSEFGVNNSRKDKLQTQCKTCRKETNNQHYKNSEARREAIRRNYKKFKETNYSYIKSLKEKGCSVCDEKDPSCMDFHHVSKDKGYNIANKADKYSLERLKKEIEKCIVICSNCHRKLHSKEKQNKSSAPVP